MKATITDIAKATGLSVSTISKYLNNKPVLPENKKKIEEAIRILDFTPNRMAQNLRSKNTRTIALVLPPLDHSLYGKLVNPIENQLKSSNYLSFVCTNIPGSSSEHSLLEYLFSNHITGILTVGNSLSMPALQKIQQKRIPCLCLDYTPASFLGDTVSADHEQDGVYAANLFLQRGHYRITIVGKSLETDLTKMRYKGIRETLEANQSFPDHQLSFHEISTLSESGLVLNRLMSAPVPPSGIICLDHLASLGLLSAIINSRLRIPEQISLFCFDYEQLFEALVPNLCSMNESYDKLGIQSAQLLLDRIDNPGKDPEHVFVPSVFYEGNTIKEG